MLQSRILAISEQWARLRHITRLGIHNVPTAASVVIHYAS